MGLLTDPKARSKLSTLISRYANVACALSYCAGLVWFCGLAHKDLNGKTYFSENALLPGLVDADFNSDHGATNFFNDLKSEIKSIKAEQQGEERFIPVKFISERFSGLGLEVYAQNYTVNDPFPSHEEPESIFAFNQQAWPLERRTHSSYEGQNVYAILRALRGSGTEAVVLSCPYRPYASRNGTLASISLMYGLAAAFKRQLYWAKDIIFLFTDNEEYGMQAWLSAYHHITPQYIETGELTGRSGSIQAALNIEFSQSSISYMDVKVEGLNGQLPNLDLVNTAVRLCRRERITPSLHHRMDYWSSDSWDGFVHSLGTMFSMMWHQSLGKPSANHGLFHQFNVEAITLQGVKNKNIKPHYGFVEIGRVIEGIVRSLNNLLERFHQSFFFYLLPSTERYASIGVYLPPIGLLVLPAILKALALWLDLSNAGSSTENKNKKTESETSQDKDDDSVKPEEKKASSGEGEAKSHDDDDEDSVEEDPKSDMKTLITLLSYVPYILMSLFFGLLTFYGPRHFISTATALHLSASQGLAVGLLAVHVAVLVTPHVLKWRARGARRSSDGAVDVRVLHCGSLLLLALMLGATAVLNASLTVFVALVWIPTFLIVRATSSALLRLLQLMLLIAVSPLGLACAASLIQLWLSGFKSGNAGEWMTEMWEEMGRGLYSIIIQAQLLNNSTYGLMALVALPNWVMMTLIVACEPPKSENSSK